MPVPRLQIHSGLERAGGRITLSPGWAYVLPCPKPSGNMPAMRGPRRLIRGAADINASMANYDSNVGQTSNVIPTVLNPGDFST